MSNVSLFFKKNKTVKPNVQYVATKSLCDEDGKPLEWEIKPISTKENEQIQNKCLVEVPIPGNEILNQRTTDWTQFPEPHNYNRIKQEVKPHGLEAKIKQP